MTADADIEPGEELAETAPAGGDPVVEAELAALEVPPPHVADAAFDVLELGLQSPGQHADLTPVLDVPVELTVEIGRTRMTIGETLAIGPGSIISLNRAVGDPVDLLVNGRRIARGEVVAVDEEFGLRVTEVEAPDARAAAEAA